MDLSVIAFLALLLAVALLRLVELRISRRHQQEMVARGAAKVDEPQFRWMVLLHTAVLAGGAFPVGFFRRPFFSPLPGAPFFVFFSVKTLPRWGGRALPGQRDTPRMDSKRPRRL